VAHDAGLAPCPRYYNPELGALVCDYLAPDNTHLTQLTETAALLRAIHSLPGCHHRLDLPERISRYERQLIQLGRELPTVMAASRAEILCLLENLANKQAPQVLCHNDLLAANRIYSENHMWAIDWEYSAMGSPWFDLAVVAIGDCLSVREQQELAQAYLERPANSDENLMFSQYCSVYRYLELLWYLTNKPSSEDLDARLSQLRDGLINS
jgi:thiamine kinase-like enzyme